MHCQHSGRLSRDLFCQLIIGRAGSILDWLFLIAESGAFFRKVRGRRQCVDTDNGAETIMTGIRAQVLLAAVVVLIVFAFLTGQQVEQPLVESRILMDTVITIRAYPATANKPVDDAFAVFAQIEREASFHLVDSELARLNKLGSLPAKSPLAPLLHAAGEYFKVSEGYFDPSFACLQRAYGFYSGVGRVPDQEELAVLLRDNCGLDKVFTSDSTGFALASGSLLDLGGIAGGYAIEKAAQVLRQSGCSAFLIDDAGDIWFEGQKPDNSAWRIAVRDPRDNSSLALIESRIPLAISTSGDYERFVTVDGVRYGHIMNPHSGRPVDYYSSLTIIASAPLTADALSTAVFAMPPEKAFKWVEEHNLAALFLTATGTIHLSSFGRQFFSQVKPQ